MAVIYTTIGMMVGTRIVSPFEISYYVYEGIPYAEQPLGDKRFRSPKPYIGDVKGLKKYTIPSYCSQFDPYSMIFGGSEDCLSLNIYSRGPGFGHNVPVMVYIHGGGFMFGDATRLGVSPGYFMSKEIVIISVAYRLNCFGFISMKDQKVGAPGNGGLKDIILALKFIKDNVEQFNGNQHNITLFGHGAGSACVQLLMQTEECEGLFHKAILMAGFYLDAYRMPDTEYEMAKRMGYNGENVDESVHKFLLEQSQARISCFAAATEEEQMRGYLSRFMPVVEPYISEDTVISVDPVETMENAWGNKIPVIVGATSFEGLRHHRKFNNKDTYVELSRHPEYLLPQVAQLRLDAKMQKKMVDKMRDIHLKWSKIALKNKNQLLDIHSYTEVYHPLHRFLSCRRQHASAQTFLYRFDYDSPTLNVYRKKFCGTAVTGVCHGDELGYLFVTKYAAPPKQFTYDYRIVKRMIDMWTAFAYDSNPNASSIEPAIWEPVEKEGVPKCLNIDKNLTMIDSPEYKKCCKWDTCFKKFNLRLF